MAKAAGVSRSTVYLLYGTRAGLFDALARYLRDESGFSALIDAFRLPDALDALRTAQRVAVRVYATMPDLAQEEHDAVENWALECFNTLLFNLVNP